MQLDWLADALRDAGLQVEEHPGWKTRTMRPFDQFHPVGLLNHHTAGSSILGNYPDPPYWPPDRLEDVCNLTIRPDGVVVVLNAGYAHDSGYGDRLVLERVRADEPVGRPTDTYVRNSEGRLVPGGPNPGALMNPWYIDIEVQHLGDGSPIDPRQRSALITSNAVICGRMEWNPITRLIGHRESTTRKIDPRWDGAHTNPMPQIRQDTLNAMEDEMAKEPLHWWSKPAFEWAIKRGIYTETDLAEIRETYDFQRVMVNLWRYHTKVVKRAIAAGGVTTAVIIEEIARRLLAGG